jgi:hypothetical protein
MNLFGEQDEPKPAKQKRGGHAAPPGTGTEGETCKTCAHLGKNGQWSSYYKCKLMRQHWTFGPGTDVRLKDKACRFWKEK